MSKEKAGKALDVKTVSSIAKLLSETDLTEIEVEHGDLHIRVARQNSASDMVAMASMPAFAPQQAPIAAPAAAPASPVASAPEQNEPSAASAASHPGCVKAPMVGTAYVSPEPGAQPYIKVGDSVAKGQTLLIIEAMKTMNQIPAPHAGTVKEIFYEDAQPVEYGEPLLIIE